MTGGSSGGCDDGYRDGGGYRNEAPTWNLHSRESRNVQPLFWLAPL
jgi:hypothetical protein